MKLIENISIKRIETKILNGRKINIKVILELDLKIYSNEDISLISNINNLDDIQKLTKQKHIYSLISEGETKVNVKENISYDSEDDLAEIIKVEAVIENKEFKLSYNKILAKAELNVSIIYLTEDNRIKNISARIPIMGFIDVENITDEAVCDINFCIKNIIIKPSNADSSFIYVEAEIEIECLVYEEKTINLIEDLYSISKDLSCNKKEIVTMSDKKRIKDVCRINNSVQLPRIAGNKLYNVKTNPTISNCMIRNGKVIYEGNLKMELIYETEGGLNSESVELPFNFEIVSDDIKTDSNVNSEIEVKRDDFIVNGSNIDMNVELEFNIDCFRNEKLNIINEIEANENQDNNVYSMVIYFVRPGDTLWEIAKKFKSTVEEIARVNEIEDIDNIKIGQQLYIPKFINKKIAV